MTPETTPDMVPGVTPAATDLTQTLRALRTEFDDSFAQAPRAHAQALENLLAIRMAGTAYALRVGDIDGLHADRRIMPLPTQAAHLLGVASFRGRVAPVYDLASLCGHPRAPSARWLVLLRSAEPVAVAFELFEKHCAVAPQDIISAQAAESAAPQRANASHLQHAMRDGDSVRPIIALPALLAAIAAQCEASHQPSRSPSL